LWILDRLFVYCWGSNSVQVQVVDLRRQLRPGASSDVKDVDAAAARQEFASVLDSAFGDTVWLEGERAWKVLRFFGIEAALPDAMPLSVDAERATLESARIPALVRCSAFCGPGRLRWSASLR